MELDFFGVWDKYQGGSYSTHHVNWFMIRLKSCGNGLILYGWGHNIQIDKCQ